MSGVSRRPSAKHTTVTTTPATTIADKFIKSRWSEASVEPSESDNKYRASNPSYRATSGFSARTTNTASNRESKFDQPPPVINISATQKPGQSTKESQHHRDSAAEDAALAEELDFVTVESVGSLSSRDKASRILGAKHRKSMEPIPASTRTSIVSSRSYREPAPTPSHIPTLPLTSLYVVSGLPKSPHTWTLADPDSVLGLHHSEGAVNRWWRPEVLGSTVSPGAGGGKKKKKGKADGEVTKGAGALSKQEVGKMLSKALKLSFTREVEVVASTLQPASTIHSFTFNLPAPNTTLVSSNSSDFLRASVLSSAENRSSAVTFPYPYTDDPFAPSRPISNGLLGPPSLLGSTHTSSRLPLANTSNINLGQQTQAANTVTYHGVCLTVWSHADAERTSAIRRTLEVGRSRKESSQSAVASRIKSLRADVTGSSGADPRVQARRRTRRSSRGPWATDGETDAETEGEGAMSESDFEVSTIGHGPGESTLFLPGDTVFWLPYALTLVSRHPIYDLMRDYLTLSWARFSKDVQSHTLQISKILAHPAPRAGELIKLDASAKNESGEASLEVIARFPGGLDFGRGLVDVNFTMWPLFKCLNIDNILTLCEIALSPTGRILFFSRYPAMLGIAVHTLKYLVELRGWNGIALSAVHSRDAKIYIDDPGPWILGLATEARYSVRPAPEVCVCDLDINYLSCSSPPVGIVSVKHQRDRYRQRLLQAFQPHYHPDHSVPSEFKEAFPAGRFRPVCKIQTKRGSSSSAVADVIKSPEWWHSTRIIQAFDAVLQDKFKKPSFLKRIASFGGAKRPPQLTEAEQLIQHSIRKRATAFVDARDDLETKIGRLSRRLNFLMTESDLWRDKFVTFEQYAEKLSVEANQLRTKINKEQKETKRLSGLVSITTAEKSKLQTQLKETESAHNEAVIELEKMKEAMEKMERERAEMVAEVEAQIERALQSMAVDIDIDGDEYDDDSRPPSRNSSADGDAARMRKVSNASNATRTRKVSDASKTTMKPLRSVSTESTLAESHSGDGEDRTVAPVERHTDAIEEVEEEEDSVPASKRKRFSTHQVEMPQDGMTAVDESISQRSDRIAQKVLEIQHKLETALAAERLARSRAKHGHSTSIESETDLSEAAHGRARASRAARQAARPTTKMRERSNAPSTLTGESTSQADRQASLPKEPPKELTETAPSEEVSDKPAPDKEAPSKNEQEKNPARKVPSSESLSVTTAASSSESVTTPTLTPSVSATAEDSDTDFQSACSASTRSTRTSHGESDMKNMKPKLITLVRPADKMGKVAKPAAPQVIKVRPDRTRVSSRSRSSTATTVVSPVSPTPDDDTAVTAVERAPAPRPQTASH